MKQKPRIIIIGTGGAGLAAAIEAAQYDVEILIVTKGYYQNKKYKWSSSGGCTWKTHGFNAAIKPSDSISAHISDTLKGGAYANNPQLVEKLCYGAVDLIHWLNQLGIQLNKNGDDIDTRPFGGNGTPRSVFIEDRLGFHIQNAFNQRIQALIDCGKVSILEQVRALEILKNDNNEVYGIKAVVIDTLECIEITGSAVIIADGGGASMYAPSAASNDKTCDGMVMALQAGASLIDMEFVQFHPTGIATDVLVFDGSLVEEVLRFDGAKLINKHEERFMYTYHPQGETATRDDVSRGIYNEIIKGNGFDNASIKLDITACKANISTKYPALHERIIQSGYNIHETSHLFIRPTAHFLMGGIKISTKAETNILGLYAAGESAGGVHGANRLGGNGLSEAMVFGRIAGANAALFSLSKSYKASDIRLQGSMKFNHSSQFSVDTLLSQLKRNMYWHVGPVRTLDNLNKMQNVIEEISHNMAHIDLGTGSRASTQIQQFFDLRHLTTISKIIVQSAMLRKESRGSHFLKEYGHTQEQFVGLEFYLEDGSLKNQFYTYQT